MKNILFSCYKSHLSRFGFSTHQFSKLEIINSSLTDIYYNLAAEEFLYEHYLVDHPILFLWRNDKTVVIGKKYRNFFKIIYFIGRHQNPHKECHLQVMEEDAVKLSRRRSGGGAVYHNLGNKIMVIKIKLINYLKRKYLFFFYNTCFWRFTTSKCKIKKQ